MKTAFCFFLLFYFCSCADNINGTESVQGEGIQGVVEQNAVTDKPRDKGQYEDSSISRPCSLQDINCIRGFFAQYSQCSVAEGPAPEPYVVDLLPNLHVPHTNLTFELVKAELRGLNKFRIEEFFINKVTGLLVMEVVFDKIRVDCPEVRIRYNRKGQEPLQVADAAGVGYDDLSFTLTIPNFNGLQLAKGNVYTFINDPAPVPQIGPAIFSSTDPGFMRAIAEMLAQLPLTLKESFVSQGPVLFFAFFSCNICDFGPY